MLKRHVCNYCRLHIYIINLLTLLKRNDDNFYLRQATELIFFQNNYKYRPLAADNKNLFKSVHYKNNPVDVI